MDDRNEEDVQNGLITPVDGYLGHPEGREVSVHGICMMLYGVLWLQHPHGNTYIESRSQREREL